MQSENKLCCPTLFTLMKEAGKKGYSVIPFQEENTDDYNFIFQFRSVDSKYYPENKANIVVAETVITYCPWCGTKLTEVAKVYKTEIDKLIREKQYLLTK